MLDIFLPYIPFIAFLIAIMINTLLVITKAPWFSYIVANVLITIVLTSIGINPFDVIGSIITYLVELIISIINSIIDGIVDGIADLIDKIFGGNDYTGGGGTGGTLR
jgi:hypothetical protein